MAASVWSLVKCASESTEPYMATLNIHISPQDSPMPTQLADNARKAHDSVIVPRARTAVAEIYLVLGHWENEASNIANFSGGKCF